LFVSAAAGFPIGALAVVVPATVEASGQDRIAGFVLACLPAGEACGAVVFGAIRFPGRRRTQLIGTLILVACTYATGAAVMTNLWLLASVIFTAGALSSPVAITISGLVDQVAPGAVAAAYAGIVSAGIGGSAIGSAVAGSLSHSWGTNSAMLAAATACTLAAIVATRIPAKREPRSVR
jgi:predicted MFS family arabinose efflux permease